MTDKSNNQQAHPSGRQRKGMTLRDHFAGQAMAAQMSTITSRELAATRSSMADIRKAHAQNAYHYADAMLAERGKE